VSIGRVKRGAMGKKEGGKRNTGNAYSRQYLTGSVGVKRGL